MDQPRSNVSLPPPPRSRPTPWLTRVAKVLPVVFIIANMLFIYAVYSRLHCFKLLENDATHTAGVVELWTFNVITFLMLVCYICAAMTGPGSIPDDPAWRYETEGEEAVPVLNLRETKRSGERRHCKWCEKYKPDRCHHCRVCRTCVLRMDHHCPWICNCVGARNHKYFFLLLLYSGMACCMVTLTMFPTVRDAIDLETKSFTRIFLLLAAETLAGFSWLLCSGLFIFHVYLMFNAMSTIEFCEKSWRKPAAERLVGAKPKDEYPYDRGCYGNICAVLGDNPLFWFFPWSRPTDEWLDGAGERDRLVRDLEPQRGQAGRPRGRRPRAEPTTAAPRTADEVPRAPAAALLPLPGALASWAASAASAAGGIGMQSGGGRTRKPRRQERGSTGSASEHSYYGEDEFELLSAKDLRSPVDAA